MDAERTRFPPGPREPYNPSDDLLAWIGDQFERFGDIYRASIYGTNAYVIRDPAYAEHVLRHNWQNYVKGQAIKRIALLLGSGLMVSEGELWKTQRRMAQPAFHRDVIKALVQVMVAENVALLHRWQQAAMRHETVDVTADTSQMVLNITLISIFGEDHHQAASFKVLGDEALRDLQFAQAFRALETVILDVVAQRRRRNTAAHDILALLMQARDRDTGRPMSDRQLVNEIKTLIVAGHETTASTLNWMWYSLSQHPEIADRLTRELDEKFVGEIEIEALSDFAYTRQIIEETLRLYPAGWLMTRKALSDDWLGGYFVPAKTEIYIPPYFIQRHPGLWDDADRFIPDRFAAGQLKERHRLAMLPFSAGPRNCIGEVFARVEMQIHLMVIARHLRLRYRETRPPEYVAGVNLRSKHSFVMTPEIIRPA